MKSINKFLKENKELNRGELAKVLGGDIKHSYWTENVSDNCITHVHDTFDDKNGDGFRNAGENGTICQETECIDPCQDT
ncbi:MAG: hypothetical protein AAF611_02305 [Bacteroidota bacterium]